MAMARSSSIDKGYKDLLLAEYHTTSVCDEEERWVTQIVGFPASPFEKKEKQLNRITPYALKTSSPSNSRFAFNFLNDSPKFTSRCSCVEPMEKAVHGFNRLSKKAEDLASNIWINQLRNSENCKIAVKTGDSVRKAAWGKVRLGAKALSRGGFKPLFKHTFRVESEEKLQKTYACYLFTSTGPVAGTLYISTIKIAFCSDRPLSFIFPSREKGWAYYRVAIPLAKVKAVNPSSNRDDPAKKYIQVVTEDDHEFWFLGFIKYQKALNNLRASLTHR
ncbi:hypothetical protein KI387_001444 [Taxus chinensis]|uniref:GRAM domain-containing protein n=1 Tax=Taxus chinensis TaxID=29808 RepID=A0AA38GW11_TAXCH|nr:hypothetical protein KI387_001444 [Taxus chinensis]